MPTPSPTCSGRRKGKIDRRNTGKRSCLRETLMRAPRSDGHDSTHTANGPVRPRRRERRRARRLHDRGATREAATAPTGSDGGDVGDGSDGAPETEVQQVGAALSGPAWDRESRRGFCTLFTDEDEIRWLFDDASAEVGDSSRRPTSRRPCSRTSNRSGRRPATVRSPSPTSASRTDARRQRDRREHRRGRRALRRGDHLLGRAAPGYRRPAAGFAPAVGNERLGRDRGADRRRRHPRP